VSSAAPIAAMPNSLSVKAPVRGRFADGGLEGIARSTAMSTDEVFMRTPNPIYLLAAGATLLPEASLMSPHALATAVFTTAGIGT
jgi:hypothetical protein